MRKEERKGREREEKMRREKEVRRESHKIKMGKNIKTKIKEKYM